MGFAFLVALLAMRAAVRAGALEDGFAKPPEETKPYCYWYWINGHISREGISRDLEAMARVGIGQAYIGNIEAGGSHGPVKVLTPEWFDLVYHAVREGARTGVKVGMFNSPGWSQSGGPWVTAEQTMRYVVSTEQRVQGPQKFHGTLARPNAVFQDIAVLAYPQPVDDTETLASHHPMLSSTPAVATLAQAFDGDASTSVLITAPAKGIAQIDAKLGEPFTARSLSIHPGPKRFDFECELLAEDDAGQLKSIRRFVADRDAEKFNVGPMVRGPVTIAFEPVRSKHFQLKLKPAGGKTGNAFDIAEIDLSAAARVDRVIEKQLGKLHPTPSPTWSSYLWPAPAEANDSSRAVPATRVQNLSAAMKPDGTIDWDAPAGDWIITRIGMTPTGAKNSPAPPEATGFEIDKMNRAVIKPHMDAFIGKVLDRLTPQEKGAFGNVIADSYEMGSQNWTDGFEQVFKQRYGYDPMPWLPVLSGRVVGSADLSDRFLWDLRRLIADRVATEYVGGLREEAHARGLQLWLENYGHWGFPSEFMRYGSESDHVAGEFWMGTDLGKIELADAASCGHVYGKNRVGAEAFTSGSLSFQRNPWDLKLRGDWAMAQGINHFILHVYIHQPYDDKVPGVNAWFGTEFNRHNTWFEESRAWIDYLRRSHFLLQQGTAVADVAYYLGDDAPKMTGICEPALPAGYASDFIDGASILRLKVQDGRLVLPSGASYRLLVLPPLETMRPEIVSCLRALVEQGATILGPRPLRSPSMEGYPQCDEIVRTTAAAMWQELDGKTKTECTLGKGKVVWGKPIATVLSDLKTPPDVRGTDDTLLCVHRRSEAFDLYFLSNQTDQVRSVAPEFRMVGRQAEVWDAVAGTHVAVPQKSAGGDYTAVPLRLAPRQSVFVVFQKPVGTPPAPVAEPAMLLTLDGPWSVTFPESSGITEPVQFDSLTDWSRNTNDRIKFFSGKATYRKTFTLDADALGKAHQLNLGALAGMAHVRLNGQDIGAVWCAPWRIDINRAAQVGENKLEIDITNNWANRLIGDQGLPGDRRQTWTSVPDPIKKGTPLQPAGLLGPVTIE